jgi:hypothetical protein
MGISEISHFQQNLTPDQLIQKVDCQAYFTGYFCEQ